VKQSPKVDQPVHLAPDPPGPSRLAPRESVVLLAFVSSADGELITQGVARTMDLSPRGAGLIAPRPLKRGARVRLELLLPCRLRLESSGRVVHSREIGVGEWRVGVAFDRPPQLVSALELDETSNEPNVEY